MIQKNACVKLCTAHLVDWECQVGSDGSGTEASDLDVQNSERGRCANDSISLWKTRGERESKSDLISVWRNGVCDMPKKNS